MDKKPIQGAGLHTFIATGGKPEDYEGTKGLDSETVPGYKEEAKNDSNNTNNKK